MMKCCVITGSRAEYGLLKPLMNAIKSSGKMKLQILVTGMHLSPEFGHTYEEIEKDGFYIDEKIEMLLSGDTHTSIVKSMGVGLIGYADAFVRLSPDWVVVLGDRFETLTAVIAAYLAKIPVAHISGGEVTTGATDEAFRHSISKMSYLHFTALEEYRKRVIQLGEDPSRVFNVGAIGLDNIREMELLNTKELSKLLKFDFTKHYALVTYHPVTLEKEFSATMFSELLKALDSQKSLRLVFTYPNADADGRIIMKMIKDYEEENKDRVISFTSLGQLKYLSLMKHASLVIGNSSSGIVEAPSFKVPVINIGDRQKGRVKAKNIIDVRENAKAITTAIDKALSNGFKKKNQNIINPYGDGKTAKKILRVLNDSGIVKSVKKDFFDL